MVTFWTWIFQIGNSDLRSPKSKLRFGNVPNQIRNKVLSGLQQFILLIYSQKKIKKYRNLKNSETLKPKKKAFKQHISPSSDHKKM